MTKNIVQTRLACFNALYKEYDDVYRGMARHFGLSDCALWMIYFIWESDTAYTQSEICGKLFQSKQTINSAMKKLEETGYLELRHIRNNKKSKQIFLTAKGVRLAKQTADKILEVERAAFSCLPEQEQESLLRLTGRYVQFLRTGMETMKKEERDR